MSTDAAPADVAPEPAPRSPRVTVALGVLAVLAVAAAAIEAFFYGGNWTRSQYGPQHRPYGETCPTHARAGDFVYWLVLALIAIGPALLAVLPTVRLARAGSSRVSVILAMALTGVVCAAAGALLGRFCFDF